MAGLIQEQTKQAINGLPGLMQVPVLGTLFKSRDYVNRQTELVVLVTPLYRARGGAEGSVAAGRRLCRCLRSFEPCSRQVQSHLRRRRARPIHAGPITAPTASSWIDGGTRKTRMTRKQDQTNASPWKQDGSAHRRADSARRRSWRLHGDRQARRRDRRGADRLPAAPSDRGQGSASARSNSSSARAAAD